MSTVALQTTPRKSTRVQSWQLAWRKGFAPQFGPRALELLARGLVLRDERILQGALSAPPPLPVCFDWEIEAADALGYLLWQSMGLETVGDLESAWVTACRHADENHPEATRDFLPWWDNTPRDEALTQLAREVNRSLRRAV